MKSLAILLLELFFVCSFCNSQITQDYPFKTFLDEDNNLFITGYGNTSGTNDIFIQKISHTTNSGDSWRVSIPNPIGDDRGLDIIVDNNENTFVTGYKFNNITRSNDIIVIRLNPDGTVRWSETLESSGDDKGMGIAITQNSNGIATEVYITGYITNLSTGKDFIIKKYDAANGSSTWQYIDTSNKYDDIATDILLDANYAYVLGYSYYGTKYLNDIVLQTYNLTNGSLQENLVDHREYSDEKPTAFLNAELSHDARMKSRIAITSVTDNFSIGNSRSFTTIYLNPNYNNNFDIRWRKEFSCRGREDVTSIAKDRFGDIYVTGYTINDAGPVYYGYDFTTIKYQSNNGGYGWSGGVKYYNHFDSLNTAIDDKASSIKVNNKDIVFVAGTSDPTPLGYSIVSYFANDPNIRFSKNFIPNFERELRPAGRSMNKWTTLHLASDGTPVMVVMSWDANDAYWAAIRYDENGNVLYTINDEGNGTDNFSRPQTSYNEATDSKEIGLTNYPNPFNPTTVISYSLNTNSLVTLKVFDMLGKEAAELVNENQTPGSHSVTFNGNNLSSGVYYYQMKVNGEIKETRRMMLVK